MTKQDLTTTTRAMREAGGNIIEELKDVISSEGLAELVWQAMWPLSQECAEEEARCKARKRISEGFQRRNG